MYHAPVRHSIARFLTAIQLTRLTMAFGAVSDAWFVVLASRAIDHRHGNPPNVLELPLAVALLLSAIVAVGLFAYGASLNDVLDVRHDAAFSPQRPIPAGRIRLGQAIVVAIGALLISILSAQFLGGLSLYLTLVVAIGILFYNAAGKFIPAVGVIAVGLVHALHMLIPNPRFEFMWPVWFVFSHAIVLAVGSAILEGKRPRITRRAAVGIFAGWFCWSAVILGWGAMRGGWWTERTAAWNIIWPFIAAVAFLFVARWKTTRVDGAVAAEKLLRYGAMWQALYGATWLLAIGLEEEAILIAVFAILGFAAMTFIKELMGQLNRPLTYRE
jgi:4-hydroxybenzoate polyprenyltransferase